MSNENHRIWRCRPKEVISDTGWKAGPIQPRFAPIFKVSKPLPPAWSWRSLQVTLPDGLPAYCLIEAAPAFEKFKAMLIVSDGADGWAAVFRLEDQPGQSGLHVHANCDGELISGPPSINLPDRLPDHGKYHRRQQNWTTSTFFHKACRFFAIVTDEQPGLFDEI